MQCADSFFRSWAGNTNKSNAELGWQSMTLLWVCLPPTSFSIRQRVLTPALQALCKDIIMGFKKLKWYQQLEGDSKPWSLSCFYLYAKVIQIQSIIADHLKITQEPNAKVVYILIIKSTYCAGFRVLILSSSILWMFYCVDEEEPYPLPLWQRFEVIMFSFVVSLVVNMLSKDRHHSTFNNEYHKWEGLCDH